jgi:tetratricopeptide (TPR) repeat protein
VEAGRLLNADGAFERALPYLERARALLPDYAGPGNAYTELAVAHRSLGQLDRAVAALETLVTLDAGAMDAWARLGEWRAMLGDTAAAIDALEEIVYIEPFDPALHRRTAALAGATGAWAREVRAREALVALAPVDRADALYRLALAYHRAGNRAAARRTVLRALDIAPDFVDAQELLLELYEGED